MATTSLRPALQKGQLKRWIDRQNLKVGNGTTTSHMHGTNVARFTIDLCERSCLCKTISFGYSVTNGVVGLPDASLAKLFCEPSGSISPNGYENDPSGLFIQSMDQYKRPPLITARFEIGL
jgi:hypothetical protein